jgi:hypothetical protein
MVAAKGAMPDSRACAKRASSKAWGFGDNTIEPILRARGGRSRHLSLGPRGLGFESLRLRALQAQGIEILIATTNADGRGELRATLGEKIVY